MAFRLLCASLGSGSITEKLTLIRGKAELRVDLQAPMPQPQHSTVSFMTVAHTLYYQFQMPLEKDDSIYLILGSPSFAIAP